MSHSHKIVNIENAHNFLLGGKATFTIVSTKTEKRYTFRVSQLKDRTKKKADQDLNAPFFVSFLNGPDSYQFVGTIFNRKDYVYSNKAKAGKDSVVNKTITWLMNVLNTNNEKMFGMVEFWHEGRCSSCNRPLTDPISIETGMGKICGKANTDVVKRRKRNKLINSIINS